MTEFFKNLPIDSSLDPIVMGEYKGYKLAAPISFWDASDELRFYVTGGCGPGVLGRIGILDPIWGLSMKAACEIHDWTFLVWNDKAGFKLGNKIFKNNMLRINQQHDGWDCIKQKRLKRIKFYYDMVNDFGEPAYYDSHLKYLI